MLDRVEMRMVQVSRKVAIVADRVLPVTPLQMPRSPRLVMTGDRGSPIGRDFANPVLIARHRAGKSASFWATACPGEGRGPQTAHVIGEDDPGVDVKRRLPRTPNFGSGSPF